ncbi:MAG: hypothetical protein JXB07_06745 [Anaerolineae bacterium]|nr:hypothetical protein [Anaerolineae bacterium]
MKQQQKTHCVLMFCGLILAALACTCGPLSAVQEAQSTIGAVQASLEPALTEMVLTMTAVGPTMEAALATANAEMPAPGGEMRQWANGAIASSEYSDQDWNAMQATGAPNTLTCEDLPTAWASGDAGEVASLTLAYSVPVVPSSIEIHQSYAPGSITKVEVVDETGVVTVVYEAQPALLEQCPYVQVIPVTGITAKVMTVIITVDQSAVDDWNEIDAVELIGTP